MTKVGLYAIGKSTTLESNKSLRQNPNYSASHFEGFASVPRHYLRDAALHCSSSWKVGYARPVRTCSYAPAGPGCAPAGPTGLRASYALDIDQVIIQKPATFAGP